jgi:large subunit ribosomal protein L22
LPEFRYSFTGYAQPYVKASGREIDVSPKATREVCKAIKGMTLVKAKEYLEVVVDKRTPVPFRRYKHKVGHRHGLVGFHVGRYPVKAATEVLEVLNNLENNADFKGLDTERLRIVHASAIGGRKVKAFVPRAQGRSSPSHNTLVHIELAAAEV